MSIVSPEKGWYSEPLDKEEKVWVAIALAWCLLTFFLMPVWHVVGKQNPSSESYRVDPMKFNEIATASPSGPSAPGLRWTTARSRSPGGPRRAPARVR